MGLTDLNGNFDPFDLEPLLGDHISPASSQWCAVHEPSAREEHEANRPPTGVLSSICGAISLHRWFLFPIELQVRVWGVAHVRDHIWICANSMSNVRTLINMVLDENFSLDRVEPYVTKHATDRWAGQDRELDLVHDAIDLYQKARKARLELIKESPYSVSPEEWRCSKCGTGMIPIFNGQKSYMHTCVTDGTTTSRKYSHGGRFA